MSINNALQELEDLQQALSRLRRGDLGIAQWSAQAQACQALRTVLPPRYGTVLDELLNRLESSQLFSEESCSFSQVELLDSLQMWLDKAGTQLPRA